MYNTSKHESSTRFRKAKYELNDEFFKKMKLAIVIKFRRWWQISNRSIVLATSFEKMIYFKWIMIRENLLLIETYVFRMKIFNRQSHLLKTIIVFRILNRFNDADHRLTNQKFFRNQKYQKHNELCNICFIKVRMIDED